MRLYLKQTAVFCWWGEGWCFVFTSPAALQWYYQPSVPCFVCLASLLQPSGISHSHTHFCLGDLMSYSSLLHPPVMNIMLLWLEPFVLCFGVAPVCTLIAEPLWDAFWIAYEPCGRECAGRRPFSPGQDSKFPSKCEHMCNNYASATLPELFNVWDAQQVFFSFFIPHDSDRDLLQARFKQNATLVFICWGCETGVGRLSIGNCPVSLLSQRHTP